MTGVIYYMGAFETPSFLYVLLHIPYEIIFYIFQSQSVHINRNHSIFRHDNFIGCFSADKIKMPARKYFCFNIPVYKNMVEEPSCRSPYHKEYIRTGASGNPEDLCH